LGSAGIGIGAFGAGYESVEFHEGVGTEGRREQLASSVGSTEFGREVGEVGKCKFTGVGAFGDADVDDFLGDEVVDSIVAALDTGLGLRRSTELSQKHLYLGFNFCQGGFGLIVVNGGTEHEAIKAGDLSRLDHVELT